ncbi:unknown protein [Simkania negevensis Z]|uniref:Uncharacterized protein n=1 Tax=Simkania negevensis (strain ATCC VR-1471 / DSM 27360 / Z) TaxID=331113 RepID=F8L816_SIMNZ|nr:unknown protein [Simkania negevensis Z]
MLNQKKRSEYFIRSLKKQKEEN